MVYCVLPKRSRQIEFCNVVTVNIQVEYTITTVKKIQNWYDLNTFPLYLVTVAMSITALFEQSINLQTVLKSL